MKVKSTGEIIDGVNHCDAFGKVDDKTIFLEKSFPCPTFSNTYGNISHSDNLPFLGGGHFFSHNKTYGTVRIRNFEWLEDTQTTSTPMTTATPTTTGSVNDQVITIPYQKDKIEKHKSKLMHR